MSDSITSPQMSETWWLAVFNMYIMCLNGNLGQILWELNFEEILIVIGWGWAHPLERK